VNVFLQGRCVVSNDEKEGNVYERLWKLWTMICKMIMDGVRDPEKVVDTLQTIVDQTKVYLRRLYETETITISATDGTETFASCGLFSGGVYGIDISSVMGQPTPMIPLTIHEMIEDGAFKPVFESLGKPGDEELEQSQVNAFVRGHNSKLCRDGSGTFFRVKGGFVALVYVLGVGRLEVHVHSFSFGSLWRAARRRRLVSPQL